MTVVPPTADVAGDGDGILRLTMERLRRPIFVGVASLLAAAVAVEALGALRRLRVKGP